LKTINGTESNKTNGVGKKDKSANKN